MKPRCYLCEKKPARIIEAKTSPDRHGNVHIYKYAYEEPVFCSKRCAINFALIEIAHKVNSGEIALVDNQWILG